MIKSLRTKAVNHCNLVLVTDKDDVEHTYILCEDVVKARGLVAAMKQHSVELWAYVSEEYHNDSPDLEQVEYLCRLFDEAVAYVSKLRH